MSNFFCSSLLSCSKPAARASFLSIPPLVCHDELIASNTHNRVIDKKKLIKLVLPTRILRMISWVLTATKTQELEFTFKLLAQLKVFTSESS
jgi:hypothetical protein